MSITTAKKYRQKVSRFILQHCEKLPRQEAEKILKQLLPSEKEYFNPVGYSEDPLEEKTKEAVPGLLHKYPNKVLLLVNDVCPVYCRFCTRKRKTLNTESHHTFDTREVFSYLKQHPEINEVILSGGDPLMLPSHKLMHLLKELASINHIQFLRIHTRCFTMDPIRILKNYVLDFQSFAKLFSGHLSFVLHINTANEISLPAEKLIQEFSFCWLYSQSVLLKGINDNVNELKDLFLKLKQIGVQPYYLHLLDKVEGSSHFEVDEQEAISLVKKLRAELPPYLLPRLIRDLPTGKVNLYY